ncbi:hypothetical protein [Nitratireductor sp. ZSWI3]|uniref:hypothetical protein n=1 Tax=Nitratireductor sp. ZSWI3 TaxID=2966359 RepID=UPI00214FB3A7|nr:hypothetical protein [Nitratireductor sp. ZSWI3]MCR4268168.1 hypothetical protein [Nitratireductor sp. ZSWI3]
MLPHTHTNVRRIAPAARGSCRRALQPALWELIASAEGAGWSRQEIELALVQLLVDTLKHDRADLATIVALRRAAWCPARRNLE